MANKQWVGQTLRKTIKKTIDVNDSKKNMYPDEVVVFCESVDLFLDD